MKDRKLQNRKKFETVLNEYFAPGDNLVYQWFPIENDDVKMIGNYVYNNETKISINFKYEKEEWLVLMIYMYKGVVRKLIGPPLEIFNGEYQEVDPNYIGKKVIEQIHQYWDMYY